MAGLGVWYLALSWRPQHRSAPTPGSRADNLPGTEARMSKGFRRTCLAVVAVTFAGTGCSDTVTDVSKMARPQAAVTPPAPTQQEAQVCVSAPAGTYDFSVSESDPFNINTVNVTDPFSLGGDTCTLLATTAGGLFGQTATTTVTLTGGPLGFVLDSIVKTQYEFPNQSATTPSDSTVTTLAGPGAGADLGLETAARLVFFVSVTPPGGDEGCTPGYWKQEQHFDSWVTYTQSQTMEDVFDIPDALGLDNVTLLDALSLPGGSGATGAARILARAAVAALLNSTAVGYPLSTAQVIAQVNTAFATSDRSAMLALAADLDAKNNLGCPLN